MSEKATNQVHELWNTIEEMLDWLQEQTNARTDGMLKKYNSKIKQ